MAISEAEAAVMEILWQRAPRSAEEILAEVGPAQSWQEGTVKSLLNRLLRKNAIHAERDGRRYLYTPLLKREQYVHHESKGLLDAVWRARGAAGRAFFGAAQTVEKRYRRIAQIVGGARP